MDHIELCTRMSEFRASFGSMAHKATTPAYYWWKIFSNPAGTGKLILVERPPEVAGSASVTAKKVLIQGEVETCFEIGDTYTSANFRRQGIFLLAVEQCTRYAQENGAAVIYGTPNDASLPGYIDKANYHTVPGIRVQVLSKRLSPRSFYKALLGKLRISWLSWALAQAMSSYARERIKWKAKRARTFSPKDASEIPDLDGSWGTRDDYAFFSVRDREFLAWRYFQTPEKYTLLYLSDANKPKGVIALKRYERNGDIVGVICDVVVESDSREGALSLLLAAESELEDCDFLEAWCATRSPYSDYLQLVGFVPISSFPVIVDGVCRGHRALLDSPDKWHYMLGDSDNI